jgi:hypothetical protein
LGHGRLFGIAANFGLGGLGFGDFDVVEMGQIGGVYILLEGH